MPAIPRSRSLALTPVLLTLALIALALTPVLAGGPPQNYDLVVPQLATNDVVGSAAIGKVMDAYTADIDAGDLQDWLALWEPDGVQMPPGTPMRTGITAISDGMAPALTQYDDEIHINLKEAIVSGTWGFAEGTYTLTTTPKMDRRGESGGTSLVDGKFLTVLHRQSDGSWKIFRDIFNSNVP